MSDVILSLCLLLTPSSGQDTARLVDDLIARTNGLKSFVANYRIHGRSMDADHKEYEGNMRLVYRSPEELLVEATSEGVRMRSKIASGRMSMLIEKDGRTSQHGEAEMDACLAQERDRIARAFREQFPALGDIHRASGPDVFVRFRFKPGTRDARPEFHLEGGTGRGDGPLFDWLGALKRSNAKPVTEGEAVVWEPAEGLRIFIQKKTGFIEKIVSTYGGETKTAIELADLSLDTEVGDDEFRSVAIDPSAQDVSESLGKSLGIAQMTAVRGLIHRKVREAVEAGTLDWTSDARARLGTVLRAYHEELAPLVSTDTVRSVRSAVDKFCLGYQELKKEIPEGDAARTADLEEKRTTWESGFRTKVEKAIEPYLARAVPDADEASATKLTGEVRALELEIAESTCRKSVVEPLLEYFTQKLELARRGELPPPAKR